MLIQANTLRLDNIGRIPVDDKNRMDWTETQRKRAEEGIEAKDVADLQHLVCFCIYCHSLFNADQACIVCSSVRTCYRTTRDISKYRRIYLMGKYF
jgi:hypothetical protein